MKSRSKFYQLLAALFLIADIYLVEELTRTYQQSTLENSLMIICTIGALACIVMSLVVEYLIDQIMSDDQKKLFYTVEPERIVQIVQGLIAPIRLRIELKKQTPYGICGTLKQWVSNGAITEKEREDTLFTLLNFGQKHGKVMKIDADFDPTCMFWFDPIDQEARLAYLEYFIEEYPKYVAKSKS